LDNTEKFQIIDPLEIPEKKAVIDQILKENADLNGATMVILNQLQEKNWFCFKTNAILCCSKVGYSAQ